MSEDLHLPIDISVVFGAGVLAAICRYAERERIPDPVLLAMKIYVPQAKADFWAVRVNRRSLVHLNPELRRAQSSEIQVYVDLNGTTEEEAVRQIDGQMIEIDNGQLWVRNVGSLKKGVGDS